MLRFVNIMLLLVMCAMIILLYQLKYESRLLSEKASKLARQIREEHDNIAVLKAEWSLLIGPDRIEPLAKKHLGLQPIKPEQFARKEWLKQFGNKRRPASFNSNSTSGR